MRLRRRLEPVTEFAAVFSGKICGDAAVKRDEQMGKGSRVRLLHAVV